MHDDEITESNLNRRPFSFVQLIKGFAIGILIGGLCLAIDVFLGLFLAGTHFMYFAAIATVGTLAVIGLVTVKHSNDTGFVRGLLIALSLAAIIATACGVAMGTGPLGF